MIYSVEDDQAIRDLVLYALKQAGFEARGFPEGDSFRQALATQLPDLVLMDQMLPGDDGEILLREMRRDPRTAHIPVIMLTAHGSELDKVRSLDSGADDYLVKPFGVLELLSRIKAVLRRVSPQAQDTRLEIGPLTLDPDRRSVTSHGEPVTLTNKEFELLKYMMRHPQIVLTRERLLDRVWDISYFGDTRTVDAHIRTLRQKLKQGAAMIGTVRGVGYRLDAEGDSST